MKTTVIYLIAFLISVSDSCAQLDKFVYDCKSEGKFDVKKMNKQINRYTSNNIFLLSESDHRYRILDHIRTDLLVEIIGNDKPEKIFYENTWEHDTLLKKHFNGSLLLQDFPDSVRNDYDFKWDIERMDYENYSYFMKDAVAKGYSDKLVGIDLGTQTIRLGLYNLCIITKSLNQSRDSIIDRFCDSISFRNRGDFIGVVVLTTDDKNKYERKSLVLNNFIIAMKKNINNPSLIKAWQSVFATYHQANAYRDLSHPATLGGYVLHGKDYARKNSFRDSVMYENFIFFLPQKWQNIVLMFSTLHLMDSRDSAAFADVLEPTTHTLGRYLHNEYGPYLHRIAFVCNDGILKQKGDDNTHYKESLEYRLSKYYDMAYVNLAAYRNSLGKKEPFYMRPTLFNYRKFNWETIFDGIVFVKDCNCANVKK